MIKLEVEGKLLPLSHRRTRRKLMASGAVAFLCRKKKYVCCRDMYRFTSY